jgi:group I intron endonuclease
MSWFVYEHICPSGKVYVGITCKKRLNDRWEKGTGYKNCTYFNHAIKKYGWDNIEHKVVLEGVSKEEAVYTEKYLIRWYKIHNLSYNLTDGGDGISGKVHSLETRLKIGRSNRGKNVGKVRSQETKNLLSKIFSKPILQIDLLTGNIIAEHPSIKQAAINIGHPSKENNIRNNLHGRNSKAFGFIWRFKNTA